MKTRVQSDNQPVPRLFLYLITMLSSAAHRCPQCSSLCLLGDLGALIAECGRHCSSATLKMIRACCFVPILPSPPKIGGSASERAGEVFIPVKQWEMMLRMAAGAVRWAGGDDLAVTYTIGVRRLWVYTCRGLRAIVLW